MNSTTGSNEQQQQASSLTPNVAAENPPATSNNNSTLLFQPAAIQNSLSQISILQTNQEIWASTCQNFNNKLISANNLLCQSEWHPSSAQLCAYLDCRSLAYAWGLATLTSNLDARPTGASQAQSPSEDDLGDGKCNELLASCPAFRNELGAEPIRRVALSRYTCHLASQQRQYFDNTPLLFNEQQQHQFNLQQKRTTTITPAGNLETWHREHTASEIGVLEDVSNVYLGGRLCAERQPKIVVEPQDMGSYYYRHCFVGRPHVEYCGFDETMGPFVISMVREEAKDDTYQHIIYRLILRVSDVLAMRVSVPEEALSDISPDRSVRNLMRELLDTVCPQISFGSLRPVMNVPKVEEMLLKIDEQPIYTRYKVGVLYCKANQSTEEQMYNNEHSSPNFKEFLDFLGTRVRLKGFDAYKGGLDTKGDTTGLYSIYTEHHSAQIMFHVSTMLPFTPNNKQQLARKRHIGNDIVTIVFQDEESLPFSPITVRSHFQHIFIVVRVCNPLTDNVTYRVAVSRAKDVPPFGPPLLESATYQKSAEFHDFLITKIINAENAVHRSRKFASLAARTRREALKELVENYAATHHTNEGASRIASRLLGGGSMKRRERGVPRPVLDAGLRAALSWQVEVFDHSLHQRTPAVLGLSADNIVLLDIPSGLTIFATPTHSVLGWIQIPDGGLKIFYDHGDMLLLWCVSPDGSEREMGFLLKRLISVTNGEEAKEVTLRKNKSTESFGFSIQEEGIVTEVDMNQSAWDGTANAWRMGLRQGTRIVEMENAALFAYSLEQIAQLLVERTQLKVTMISPASDGNPRRGCEDSNCPAVRCQELQIIHETSARPPLNYQQNSALRKQPGKQQQLLKENQQQGLTQIGNSGNSFSNNSNPAIMTLGFTAQERKKYSAPIFGNQTTTQQQQQRRTSAKSSIDSSSNQQFFRAQHFSEDSIHPTKEQSSLPSGFIRACSDDFTTITIPGLQNKQAINQEESSLEETLLLHSLVTQAASSTYALSASPRQEALIGTEIAGLTDKQCQQQHSQPQTEQQRRISTVGDEDLAKCQWWLQKTLEEKRMLETELDHIRTQLTAEQRMHAETRRQLQIITEYCERFQIIPPPFEEEDEEL